MEPRLLPSAAALGFVAMLGYSVAPALAEPAEASEPAQAGLVELPNAQMDNVTAGGVIVTPWILGVGTSPQGHRPQQSQDWQRQQQFSIHGIGADSRFVAF